MPHKVDYDLEEDFPNLRSAEWQDTSKPASNNNCIAYAANDKNRYWDTAKGYYWPPGAIREYSMEGWTDAFRVLNYQRCETADLEVGFEKVAIYKKQGKPSHVARQLDNGYWTSKLGPDEDINHSTLAALEGEFYGEVDTIMKRSITAP